MGGEGRGGDGTGRDGTGGDGRGREGTGGDGRRREGTGGEGRGGEGVDTMFWWGFYRNFQLQRLTWLESNHPRLGRRAPTAASSLSFTYRIRGINPLQHSPNRTTPRPTAHIFAHPARAPFPTRSRSPTTMMVVINHIMMMVLTMMMVMVMVVTMMMSHINSFPLNLARGHS